MRCQREQWQGQGRMQWMRICLLACAMSGAAVAGALFPLFVSGPSGGAVAYACGLGNLPTMMANNAPSLLYPVVKNTPANQPLGIFAGSYVANQPISFLENMSRVVGAPDPSTLQWRWDFGDKSPTSSDISPQHTYAKAGTYNIHAQIFDTISNAWTDVDSAQITVIPAALPNPPVAQIAQPSAALTTVSPGGSITFDATGSHAAVGSKLTYFWNFNDGSTATGQQVTHTFAVTGYGIVALIVTDTRGAIGVATANIAVLSTFPAANVSASALSVSPGSTVSFNASKSTAPQDLPGDRIVKYVWDFGDGSPKLTTQSPTTSHTYHGWGTYTVAIQAFDVVGVSGTTHLTITVGYSYVFIGGAVAGVILLWGIGYLIVASRKRASLAKARTAREAQRELARSRRVGASRAGQSGAGRPRPGGSPAARGERRGPPPGDSYPRGRDATGRYPQRGGPSPRARRDSDDEWGSSSVRRRPSDEW